MEENAQCVDLKKTFISITSSHGPEEGHPRRRRIFNYFVAGTISRSMIELNESGVRGVGLDLTKLCACNTMRIISPTL